MYEITYYSLAKRNLTADDIGSILETARHFNSKSEITGCLLFHKNQFIQVLEGEKTVLKDLLLKIERDERHFNIIIMAEGEKDERNFKNWTMAYRELSDDDVKEMSDALFINNFLTFSSLALKPTHTIRLFWTRVERLLTNDYTA